MGMRLTVEGEELPLEIERTNGGFFTFRSGDRKLEASLRTMEYGVLQLVLDGHAMEFAVSTDRKGQGYVSHEGYVYRVRRGDVLVLEDVFGTLDSGAKGQGAIISPMPGKVIKVSVKKGQAVKKGDLLLVVEAMKMENNILAPGDGRVEAVNVKVGVMVDGSTELVSLANSK